MRDALLPCIGSVSLLFCWFVCSFIPKSACTCLDEVPGHKCLDWLEMAGSRFNIALGMASQNLFAKVVQIRKEKQKRPPVLWACWSRSVCVSYSCSSSFLRLKSLTGEQGIYVSFYTVLWGFHNPVWPCSSAFIMSLWHKNPSLLFCLHNFSPDSSVISYLEKLQCERKPDKDIYVVCSKLLLFRTW